MVEAWNVDQVEDQFELTESPTMAKTDDYFFDTEAADAAAAFFPTHLRYTAGEWANQPFVLQPWEADDIIRPLFGWKRKSDGTRRYRRCYVWVPRKNGKTELAAGVGILATVGDGEAGGQVLSIASDKNQASLVFDKAVLMVGWSPELSRELVCFKTSIYCPSLGAVFKPLAGIPKGKHGLNMSGLIGDELHEWTSDRLYQYVHQSSASRRQPIEFMISTAGERSGYGWEIYQMCLGILSGEIDDPETLVVIYGANADADKADPDYWKNPATWREANPNYGVSVKAEYLAAEALKAQRLPRLENDFKRYHLNLWVEQATRWLPMDAWEDCGTPAVERPALRAKAEAIEHAPIVERPAGPLIVPQRINDRWRALPELMAGRRCFGGIDLSSVTDLTCLAWLFEPLESDEDGLVTIVPRFYVPEVGIGIRAARDKVPYEDWRKMGALTATPGNAVDYSFLKRQLFADAETFRVAEVAIDRWNATQMAIELRDEGIEAKLFGQGFASMNAPSKQFEKLLLNRRLDHGGHPVMTWCARNAAVETDAAGNIKPSKSRSTERIDGIVAAVMALGASMEGEKEPDIAGFIARPVFA